MSAGSLDYSRGHVPVGYVTPPFPSLSFHISQNPYTTPLLFYSWDIYVFTVYWSLIFSVGFHVAAITLASFASLKVSRHNIGHVALSYLVFAVLGAFYGFVTGSFIGLILGSVYRAGAVHMSTWTPFTWGLAGMIFAIIVSYEQNAIVL